jgi:heavy metal sensor kinase
MRGRLPIRLRLTLVFSLCMAVLLAVAGTFLYRRLATELTQSTDAALRSQASVVAAGLNGGGGNFGDQTGSSLRGVETFAQVLTRAGTVLDSSQAIGTAPLLGSAELGSLQLPTFLTRAVPGVGISRLLVVGAGDGGSQHYVVVGTSLARSQELLSRFLAMLLIGGPIALVVTSGCGWLLAGGALRPVERVRREAAAVSVSELDRRLPVPPAGDELARLVTTLNEMLARLEASFAHERRFVAVASHELRTPLTNMKAELDLALSRARTPAAMEEALRSSSIEADRLAALAEDLLVYSRVVGGVVPIVRAEVELGGLVRASCEAHERVAHRAGVDIQMNVEPVDVSIDGIRMRQVIDNLMDNALRHTPSGGSVTVDVAISGASLRMSVRDTGAGFDTSMQETAFDPFVRGDGESAGSSGAGLGLAIVHAVVKAHGGSVELHNAAGGGAEVSVTLPLERASISHARLTSL